MVKLRNVGGAMCGAVPTQIGLSRMGSWPDLSLTVCKGTRIHKRSEVSLLAYRGARP